MGERLRRIEPKPTILITGQEELVRLLLGHGAMVRTIVLYLDELTEPAGLVLGELSRRHYSTVTIPVLPLDRISLNDSAALDRLGFHSSRCVAWEAQGTLELRVGTILRQSSSLLPQIIEILDVPARPVRRICAAILDNPAEFSTVGGLARRLGYRSRHTVEKQLGRYGIRALGLLHRLKLLCVADWAAPKTVRPTLREVADQFGYASPDAFGRLAQRKLRCTGVQ